MKRSALFERLVIEQVLVRCDPPPAQSIHELLDSMEDTSKRHGRPLRNSSRETIDQLRLALEQAS